MAVSLTYLALIILCDALFFGDFLIVSHIRYIVDTATKKHDESSPQPSKIKLIIVGVLLGPIQLIGYLWREYGRKQGQPRSQSMDENGQDTKKVLAFMFGRMRKPKMEEHRFSNWTPLPYKFGAITTSIIIIFVSILFSDKVQSKIGIDPLGANAASTLCTDNSMTLKVDQIMEKLLRRSNFASAMSQLQVTNLFLGAIQNDTALWGEPGYYCTLNPPYTKTDFRNSPEYGYGGDAGLQFFPGQCEAAQERALEAARSRQCQEEFCNTGSFVDPDSIQNGDITGLDDLERQIATAKHALKNIRGKCDNCKIFGGIILGRDPDIRISGKEKAEKALDGIDVESIGIRTPKYVFTDQDVCGSHTVACPDFSRYDALSEELKDANLVKLHKLKNATVDFAAQSTIETRSEIFEKYVDFVKLLLKQMEIASYIYAGYTCLTLLFPTPLILFRRSLKNQIRSFFFGAEQFTFVISSVALWWGVQYFRSFEYVKYFEIYMKVFLQDPCVARQEYVSAISGNYSTICSSMISAQSKWSNANNTIHDILTMVGHMVSSCCGPYPYEALNQPIFTKDNIAHTELMREYGFIYDLSGGGLCGDSCYLPSFVNISFIGNLTTCEDNDFVRREILELSELSTISWWGIWVSSGVLAHIILPMAVSRFGVSVVRLADPFMSCDGKYVGPPKGFQFNESGVEGLMKKTKEDLILAAKGRVLFWALFTNVMMFNIAFARNQVVSKGDSIVAAVIIPAAVIIAILAQIASIRIKGQRKNEDAMALSSAPGSLGSYDGDMEASQSHANKDDDAPACPPKDFDIQVDSSLFEDVKGSSRLGSPLDRAC